ncbi:MAG: flagellar hook-associated protein FlgK [Planctomycetes bacterium]|nr:flagellar hook-associated protein FlgK [Planctomycetota bacterium]
MSNIGLNIGLQGLLSSQASLDTIGHNITNANTPGYSRQSLEIGTATTVRVRNLLMGNGVQASVVRRTVDQLLNARLVVQQSGVSRLDARLSVLGEAEGLLGNTSESGLGKSMQSFFTALSNLSATPEDPVLRSGAVQSASQLTSQFNQLATNVDVLRDDTIERLQAHVDAVNELAEQISGLNKQISATESSGVTANDLRDRRENMLRELAKLVDAKAIEDSRGAVRVLVGGSMLVSPTTFNQMQLSADSDGTLELEIEGQSGVVTVTSGAIGGLLQVYEDTLPQISAQLDSIAHNWILELNRVHTTGLGGDGPFKALVAANPFEDVDGDGAVDDELLANSGLPFDVVDGELVVNVTNTATGALDKHVVSIDATRATVADLVAELNTIGHLTANIDGQGRLHVFAEPGYGFDFSSRLDTNPDAVGSFGGGQASITSASNGPFALADGDTLQLTGPAGSFTVTFDAADFAQIGAATSEELAAAINADPTAQANGLVASVVGERLVLQTAGSGATESFSIDGGTALASFGWNAATTVTGHDSAVSVTIGGIYSGSNNDAYQFVPNMDGVIGTTAGLKVLVYDQAGQQVAALDVGAGYNPGDELEILNGVTLKLGYGTLSATDNDTFRLDVTADSDTSDILPALGLNVLFTGEDARSIGVRADLEASPSLLASSISGAPGDGSNLLALMAFDESEISGLSNVSFAASWADIVSSVGLDIDSSRSAYDAEEFLMQSLDARRDQVSGVNVDEELVNMMTSEQAYNAAAQFIRVSADLSDELMRLL